MSATPSTGRSTADPPQTTAPERPAARETHDWKHLAETPEFQRLHSSRRRFTLTGLAIETGALILVMGLYGFAPDAMGKPAIGSITWALLSGAGLVLLTFIMAWAYARKAREWEDMAAAALEHSERRTEPTGRFQR
jgi:uncharacterized membrane protein (DUF485 family)